MEGWRKKCSSHKDILHLRFRKVCDNGVEEEVYIS